MEINSSPVSYQGLNRTLSKRVLSNKTVLELDRLNPKSNGIVGNIPPQWVQGMPVEERGELIPQLYTKLGNFISKVLPKLPGTKIQSAILTNILRKHKAIDSSSSVTIEKIGKGALSKGYRIKNESDGTALFLKRFVETHKNKSLRETGTHGAVPENNLKTFLKHDLKTKKEKSLFTNFHYGDIKNGYYVEEYLSHRDFVNPDSILPTNIRELDSSIYGTLYKHGLCHADLHERNVKYYFDKNEDIAIKCFDLGGAHTAATFDRQDANFYLYS